MLQTELFSDENFRERELNFDDGGYQHHYREAFDMNAPVALVDNPEDNVDNLDEDETLSDNLTEILTESLTLDELKNKLSTQIIPLHQLKPPSGVATGIDVIDNFLLWKGFPKGDLTLISGNPGTGATSLWLNAAAQVQAQKKWVAWINSEWELLPSALVNKKINLEKLLVVKKPTETSQLYWILQEMISSSLFEMVGCHLNDGVLKAHQLHKLKKLARTYQVALVFVTHSQKMKTSSMYSLVIECQGDFFVIKRAAHRPTPFTIPGGLVHADLMSQLTTEPRSLLR